MTEDEEFQALEQRLSFKPEQGKNFYLKQKEALKLALEALEYHIEQTRPIHRTSEAITAIREALAEQPAIQQGWDVDDLLDKPKQPAQQQEPVGTVKELFTQAAWERLDLRGSTKVYTSPPASKSWVNLTEQEHTDIAIQCGCMSADWVFYGATVERILKEKNS